MKKESTTLNFNQKQFIQKKRILKCEKFLEMLTLTYNYKKMDKLKFRMMYFKKIKFLLKIIISLHIFK